MGQDHSHVKMIQYLSKMYTTSPFVSTIKLKNIGHCFVLFRVAPENFGDNSSPLDTEVSGVINKCRKLHSLHWNSYVCNTLIDRVLRHFSQAKQFLSKLRISKLPTLNHSYLSCSPVKHRTLLELTHL